LSEERLERVASQIRIDRDGVRAQMLKRGARVRLRRIGNIAALGIENDRDVRRHARHHVAQRGDACRAEHLEERAVHFERRSKLGGGIHQAKAFGAQRVRIIAARIQTDAEQTRTRARRLVEPGKKILVHAFPNTIARSAIRTYKPYSI